MSVNGPVIVIGQEYAEEDEIRHLTLEIEFPVGYEEVIVSGLKAVLNLPDPVITIKTFQSHSLGT